jgi:hypothetical protein
MSNELFIINNINGICGIYNNLNKAKDVIKSIYESTPNYRLYDYKINIYELIDTEYIITNTSYTYILNVFFKHNNIQ